MTTVYLSSTYEDLKEHRDVVYKALCKSGYDVIAMEDYVAADQRPVDKCLADVSRADIYVGIFAFRYGYVPPEFHGNPKKLSITELEFRQAENLKKPCLTFIVNDSTPWPRNLDDARVEEDKDERVNRLRKYLLTEKLASSFSEPHELAVLVQAAVTKCLEQRKAAEKTGFRDTLKDGSQGPEMVVISGGEFKMGDIQGSGLKSELPVHTVQIPRPFAIGRYPVTFEMYGLFARARKSQVPNDKGWGGGRRPVINVSWHDAVEFSKWLSEKTGKRYRLPTEAEWEYAARAGTDSAYWWGNEIQPGMANYDDEYSHWAGKQTSPVGSFQSNSLGIYDMAGNVFEWVQDCWHENYNGAPTDGSAREEGDSGHRVIRGGSWGSAPEALRSSFRFWFNAVDRGNSIGFRFARDLE
jgi:formylglycine-generating enzyme required for sulfatase activity